MNIDYTRQMGLVPPSTLQTPVTIVGAGGIGSWATLALAKMGVADITVYDHDHISWHNVPSQFLPVNMLNYYEKEWEQVPVHDEFPDTEPPPTSKVSGLHNLIWIATDARIKAMHTQYGSQSVSGILISAVDTMATRRMIWDSQQENMELEWFIDGRIGGQSMAIYCVDMANTDHIVRYEEDFFDDDEALELPCTERAVVYVGLMVGALIARLVAMIGKGEKPPFFTAFNAEALELATIYK